MNTKKQNILLIGELNSTTKDIETCLREYFDVQLCDVSIDNVKKMTDYMKPRLTVFSLVGAEEDVEKIFTFLDTSEYTKNNIVIGNKTELSPYKNQLSPSRFDILYRPVKRWNILYHCCIKFGIDVNILEKKKQPAFFSQKQNLNTDDKTILLVDDSKIMLRNMKQWLDKKFKTELADSAEKAMQKIQQNPPDLILLDYDMPGCDGREFFEKLSQIDEYKDIPVIFLTAVDNKSKVLSALKLLPVRYMLKPVDYDQLINVIEGVFYDDEIS